MYLGNAADKADPAFSKPVVDLYNEVDTHPRLPSPTQILTILDIGGRSFPVYLSHYICWRAIVHNMERCAQRAPGTVEPNERIWDLPGEDVLWGILAAMFIEEVKTTKGISSLQPVLI
jgi:hypothetical protein